MLRCSSTPAQAHLFPQGLEKTLSLDWDNTSHGAVHLVNHWVEMWHNLKLPIKVSDFSVTQFSRSVLHERSTAVLSHSMVCCWCSGSFTPKADSILSFMALDDPPPVSPPYPHPEMGFWFSWVLSLACPEATTALILQIYVVSLPQASGQFMTTDHD